MSIFNWHCVGELTKKEEQKLQTIEKILMAFYKQNMKPREEKRIRRTWNELLTLTNVSSRTLHKYLNELIKQKVVKGFVNIDENNNQVIFYEYNKKAFFEIMGTKPTKIREVVRIYKTQPWLLEGGYLKKGRKSTEYYAKKR
jgi:hypothetical protein